ncbi:hypothetical protein AJ87_30260 [Rhizobium yanglingense]|nr:hypothetical protein AJ87_30260 [Rhizobium yanglingense]
MASTDNFAFLLPVMMLTFGCTFLLVAGSDRAKRTTASAENLVIVNLAGYPGVQAGEERESGLGPLRAGI